jgi:guanyl-specific ribonuclease Sa
MLPWWVKILSGLLLVLLIAWLYSEQQGDIRPAQQPKQSAPPVPTKKRAARNEPPSNKDRLDDAAKRRSNQLDGARADAVVVRNVRVTDEDNRVIYRGDIDLSETLDRIERGERLRFSHDGITFENREKRLPYAPSGYYREFVHPTKGDTGPGGQRVVVGRKGEVYYTPDHYRTFRRVR